MNFDFADPGNGPEVLAAGVFTIVAVVGSVLLALWSQRRDFDRRELEMKSTYKAQEESEWATWRRHMAERAMGVITDAVQAGLALHNSGRSYLEAHHEVDEIHSLLHLDPHPSGRIVGDWLMHTCHEMDLMRPVNTREKVLLINETASIARAQVMVWAYKPESALKDQGMVAAAAAAHQGNNDWLCQLDSRPLRRPDSGPFMSLLTSTAKGFCTYERTPTIASSRLHFYPRWVQPAQLNEIPLPAPAWSTVT